VFDKDLGKWVNKAPGAAAAVPTSSATPPPPRSSGTPARLASGIMGPPTSAPPTGGLMPSAPIGVAGGAPPMGRVASMANLGGQGEGSLSRPPSRPASSMSNVSDIDDLLGPAAPRRGGAKKGARKGRYVDVMANQK
jgi:hypothetical protein